MYRGLGAVIVATAATLLPACGDRPLEFRARDAGMPDAGSAAVTAADAGAPGLDTAPDHDIDPGLCPPDSDDWGPTFSTRPPPPGPVNYGSFSCDSLPATYLIEPPGSGTGLPAPPYRRCVSFHPGAAVRVALSADGRTAALVPEDGVVRMVEVASRQVTVLPNPRGAISVAAFSPLRESLLTVDAAQGLVKRWPSSTRGWTTPLPVQARMSTYASAYASASFSPDGQSVAVSTGAGVFLLDYASGVIRASRPTDQRTVVTDLSFAAGGTRIVTVETSLTGHCSYSLTGGKVMLLRADSLAPIATLMSSSDPLGSTSLSQMRASPTGNVLLVAPTLSDQAQAFDAGDGTRLPDAPAGRLPLALMPGGDRVLRLDEGELRVIRLADGAVLARAPAPDVGESDPLAVSADGAVVAVGGAGDHLLRVWDTRGGALARTCATESRPDAYPPSPVSASLSASGDLLALGWGADVRLIDPIHGTLLGTLAARSEVDFVRLSPDGRYLLARLAELPAVPWIVFRTTDGSQVAEIPTANGVWGNFVFAPDGSHLYASSYLQGAHLMTIDLRSGQLATSIEVPAHATPLGFSAGCIVLYDQTLGAWRSCASCQDPPVGAGTRTALLSADGRYVATRDAPMQGGAGATLWRLYPDPGPMWSIGPRPENVDYDPEEHPVAITPGARRFLTGADTGASCGARPSFEVRVYDGQTGALVDKLPPSPTSVDALASTVAYGTQLWCAGN